MNEGQPFDARILRLPKSVERTLLVVEGRSGLKLQELEPLIVDTLRRFDHPDDDYLSLVFGHRNTSPPYQVLGIHEEVRERVQVMIGFGREIYQKENPFVRNIWVGDKVKFYTPEEAADIPYSGRTALDWAKQTERDPRRVVRAGNGNFYAATLSDIALP